jgi:biopolymer transport protein ExbD
MSSPNANSLARLRNTVWSMALLVLLIMISAVPRSGAQALQKGISVELAPTSSAAPVPDADRPEALIIAVTDSGKIYLGIEPVVPSSLAEKLKGRLSRAQSLYIKADARAPYACVVKVLDAAHAAGVASVILLTTQPKATQARVLVSPEGIEMEMARRSPALAK